MRSVPRFDEGRRSPTRRRVEAVKGQIVATRELASAQANAVAAKLRQARESRVWRRRTWLTSRRPGLIVSVVLGNRGLVPQSDTTEAGSRADAERAQRRTRARRSRRGGTPTQAEPKQKSRRTSPALHSFYLPEDRYCVLTILSRAASAASAEKWLLVAIDLTAVHAPFVYEM